MDWRGAGPGLAAWPPPYLPGELPAPVNRLANTHLTEPTSDSGQKSTLAEHVGYLLGLGQVRKVVEAPPFLLCPAPSSL